MDYDSRMGGGYYPDATIANRIEEKRIELGLTVEAAAEIAGFSHWNWYKKAAGASPFTIEQVGRIAAGVKAPLGWPFIEWSAARLLERSLEPASH